MLRTTVWACCQLVLLLLLVSASPATAGRARTSAGGNSEPRGRHRHHGSPGLHHRHRQDASAGVAADSDETSNVIDPCQSEGVFEHDIILDRATAAQNGVEELWAESSRQFRRHSLGYTYRLQSEQPDPQRHRRAATSLELRLWPGGVIPYTISDVSNRTRHTILAAIAQWEEHTCLKFVRRTDQRDYIYFFRGSSCCSYVGRLGVGKQPLSIGPGCQTLGIVLHEIGHAVGFWHEQSRPDRDEFVEVLTENVASHSRYNFNKMSKTKVDSLGQPYDYNSIMHYGTHDFSENGLQTLKPKDKDARIGSRQRLSASDIMQTNLLYQCSKVTECGGTRFGSDGYIMSPNYPYKYPGNSTCEWVISVPESFTMIAEFQHFDLPDKVDGVCKDYVELRNGMGEESPLIGRYCGNIPPRLVIADGESLWVKFQTGDGRYHDKTGFFIDFKSGTCRQVLTDLAGSIESLGYPLTFPPDMDCVWQISVPQGFIITLAIRDLYIADGGSGCSRDYLMIIDGDSDSSQLITKLCQPQSNVGVATSGPHLRLRLHSGSKPENSIGELGMRFAASYTARDIDECSVNQGGCEQACLNLIGTYACGCRWGYRVAENNKNCTDVNECDANNGHCSHTCENLQGAYVCKCPTGFYLAQNQKDCIDENECDVDERNGCDHRCSNTLGAYQCSCYPGYMLGDDQKTCEKIPNCREYFTDHEGVIKSPAISNPTNNTADCVWSISVDDDMSVAISLTIEDWPQNNENCRDFIRFRQGHGPEGRTFRVCHPSDWPGDYNTHAQVVWISYHSEWPHEGVFAIYYRAVKKESVNSQCGGVLNGTTGILESPGFPYHYPNKVDCVWKITGKTIKLKFEVFDLERQENCRFDFLDISDGHDNSLGRFCGERTPPPVVTSSTGELWITFQSDASVQGQGFRASIEIEL